MKALSLNMLAASLMAVCISASAQDTRHTPAATPTPAEMNGGMGANDRGMNDKNNDQMMGDSSQAQGNRMRDGQRDNWRSQKYEEGQVRSITYTGDDGQEKTRYFAVDKDTDGLYRLNEVDKAGGKPVTFQNGKDDEEYDWIMREFGFGTDKPADVNNNGGESPQTITGINNRKYYMRMNDRNRRMNDSSTNDAKMNDANMNNAKMNDGKMNDGTMNESKMNSANGNAAGAKQRRITSRDLWTRNATGEWEKSRTFGNNRDAMNRDDNMHNRDGNMRDRNSDSNSSNATNDNKSSDRGTAARNQPSNDPTGNSKSN